MKPASSKGISINDIHLSPDDLEMYIDLAPFVNPSPYVVPEDMSLTKVHFSSLVYSYCIHLNLVLSGHILCKLHVGHGAGL